ncbi:MAG: transcriptional regulator NrdR [bacterium]
MKCPACYQDTKVIDSRVANDGLTIRRRRECLKCEFRFSTYEEMEILDLNITKRDGRKEAYQRDKLASGLKKSFEKRPITEDNFKKLINNIERDLQVINKNEIPSDKIGAIVMKHIKKVDKVAYIRFASVYLDFKDVEEFKEALNDLVKDRKKK